jgi:nicotinate-nucleotide pyrophosphorylase (carboxylating)
VTGWADHAPAGWEAVALAALAEDLGDGDRTAACLPAGARARWMIEAQASGALCGVGLARWLLNDGGSVARAVASDGQPASPGQRVLEGEGTAAAVFARERTALNFLMLLSGVATLTARYVEAVRGLPAAIVDTRKTIPGLRALQKYAVRCGGGGSHRSGLYDGILIKDNHIVAAGGIASAVASAIASASHLMRIEVECETPEQVREAVAAGADVILLDNMAPGAMRRVVDEFGGRCLFEASGGVTLESVAVIAAAGVDLISVGELTHSAPALPFHLEVLPA